MINLASIDIWDVMVWVADAAVGEVDHFGSPK